MGLEDRVAMDYKKKYSEVVNEINPSPELVNRIKNNKENKMIKFSKSKVVVLVAVACMTIGTSVFAAGKIASYRSWSSNLTEVSDISKSRDNAKKLGASLEIPESFSNGYAFDCSYSGGIEGLDEDGNAVANGKFDVAFLNGILENDVDMDIDEATNEGKELVRMLENYHALCYLLAIIEGGQENDN